MRITICLLLFQAISFLTVAQSRKEPVKVTDMLRIKTINQLSLDKDGSKAVFTLTSIEPEGDSKLEYKYVTQVWMTNMDGSISPKQLTSKENSSQPVFSPDGKEVAFTRVVEGKSQVFLLPLDGGEAIQLTRFKYGASNPQWSPGGKHLLFSASIPLADLLKDSLLNPQKEIPTWSLEKPGFEHNNHLNFSAAKPDPDGSIEEIRAYLEKNATDQKARVINKLNFQDESGINADLAFNHFFITTTKPGGTPVPVSRGFYRFNYAAFTPDGNRVLLGGDMDQLQHPDRSLEGQVYIVNTDGSGLRKILGQEGRNYASPRISKSGKWLAFQYSNTGFVNIPTLAIMPLDGTLNEKIDIPFDRSKGNLDWSADDRYLYFISTSNGGFPLFRADINTKKVEQLTDYNSGVGNFDIAGERIVFTKTDISNPGELYTADAAVKNSRAITRFNTDWLQEKNLSIPEKRTFKNEKQMEIEYWVMKPTDYQPGKKYPLMLGIHGGPTAMWGPGESTMWHEFQYFCSKGYGIVYCNPRGSGGYGLDFLKSNINDWGTGPSRDVLTALDKTIAAESWVDTSKLVITGGSYAGYLVNWIIAHDKRFKAACSQRGVYDLATFFGEGNAWRLIPNYFGGYPWEPATRTTLERESPIKYVQHITTPYIIFHGENDRRTGVTQSEMLYRSLKVLGRPVEYVRHPNATHEITRSGNNRQRIDQMLRTYEFFARWIR